MFHALTSNCAIRGQTKLDVEFARPIALVARASNCSFLREYGIDRRKLRRRQRNIGRADVVFQVADLMCPGNGDEGFPLVKDPGQ